MKTQIVIEKGVFQGWLRKQSPETIHHSIVRWSKGICENRLLKQPDTLTKAEVELATAKREKKDTAEVEEFKIANKTIIITPEIRKLRSLPASAIPENTIRYAPNRCGNLCRGKNDLTKAEKAVGHQYQKTYHYEYDAKRRRSQTYFFQNMEIHITPEMKILRNSKIWEVPNSAIRFSPNICASRVWNGKGYKMTEAEKMLGWNVLREKYKENDFPPQILVLRRVKPQYLPSWIVRYSPPTLRGKLYRKQEIGMTAKETEIARKENSKNSSENHKRKKEQGVPIKESTREKNREAVRKHIAKKNVEEKKFLENVYPINLSKEPLPSPPLFPNVKSLYTNSLYKRMIKKYILKKEESCVFCLQKFKEEGNSRVSVSHIVPRSRLEDFGIQAKDFHLPKNLVVMCRKCVYSKREKTLQEWTTRNDITGELLEKIDLR